MVCFQRHSHFVMPVQIGEVVVKDELVHVTCRFCCQLGEKLLRYHSTNLLTVEFLITVEFNVYIMYHKFGNFCVVDLCKRNFWLNNFVEN